MNYTQVAQTVQREAPLASADTERAVVATLATLFRWLPAPLARELAQALPKPAAGDERAAPHPAAPDDQALEAFYAGVERLEQVERARAVEHAQVVCAALARHVDPELRTRVQHALPNPLARLFELPESQWTIPDPRAGHARDLAEGQPGSRHGLSDSAPGSSHPLSEASPGKPQSHSVHEPNPHADTKVSSTRGLTQQRENESLAEGRSKLPR